MTRSICVVITARASYAKIKPILRAISLSKDLELSVVTGGSANLDRFGDVSKMVEDDGYPVSERLDFHLEGETLLTSAKTCGFGIAEFSSAFDRLSPDCVLVMADRYEVMAAAVAAAYLNIPLAHVQGGEISGNIDEKVRHAITKLADYHFPATELARRNIIQMGEDPSAVFLAGCPSIDIARQAAHVASKGNVDIYSKYGGVGGRPSLDRGYYIVMQHSVTNEQDSTSANIDETLHAVAQSSLPIIWFWPNADAGTGYISKALRGHREQAASKNIHFVKNMDPLDFLIFMKNSSGIIGNSSAAIREASFLGVPAINIGSRQSGRERAKNVIDVDYDRREIQKAISTHLCRPVEQSSLYGDGFAADRIAAVLSEVELRVTKRFVKLDKCG